MVTGPNLFLFSLFDKYVTLISDPEMVKLNIKKGDDLQFLYETTVDISVDDLMADVLPIFNGRLKVQRLCAGIHVLFYTL